MDPLQRVNVTIQKIIKCAPMIKTIPFTPNSQENYGKVHQAIRSKTRHNIG